MQPLTLRPGESIYMYAQALSSVSAPAVSEPLFRDGLSQSIRPGPSQQGLRGSSSCGSLARSESVLKTYTVIWQGVCETVKAGVFLDSDPKPPFPHTGTAQ